MHRPLGAPPHALMDDSFRHRPADRLVEPMFAALHSDESGSQPAWREAERAAEERASGDGARARGSVARLSLLAALAVVALLAVLLLRS